MLSKKQRKASRFYNSIVRKSSRAIAGRNQKNVWKENMFAAQRERRDMALRLKLAIPPISYMRRREETTTRPTMLSFIPKSARAIMNLFKKAA